MLLEPLQTTSHKSLFIFRNKQDVRSKDFPFHKPLNVNEGKQKRIIYLTEFVLDEQILS